MDMFTSYGHINKLKLNHRFFDDFRPGHVPLTNLHFHIIGTHSNNVVIWFTKRILGTVFLCPFSVCPK